MEEIAAAIQKTSACRIFIENSKTEKSVMKNTSTPGVDWLAEQLSFKLYDLNIPSSAIKEILQGSKTILKNRAHLHDIDELNNVFTGLLKMPIQLSNHF